MDTEEQILNIIAKKLHGQATVEELDQLQSWLDADKGNQLEYEKLLKIWEEIDGILSQPSFDTNAAWNKMDAGINNQVLNKRKTKPAVIIAGLFSKRATVAAAAIVFVVAGFYVWNKNNLNRQTFTAEKGNQLINLPDRSVVLLRKGSTIKYPAVFNKNERMVELSGEAFFTVSRNEQQPFIITTANSKVKVLGTSFLVRSKAAMDEIVVVTGKVSVTDKEKAVNQLTLVAGQKAVLQNDKFQQSQVNDSNFIAWKNGLLDFKEASLVKVLDDVSHYYEIPIGISGEHRAEIEKMRINVHFEKQSLEQVLEEIKLITGLQIKKENNKTFFYQK